VNFAKSGKQLNWQPGSGSLLDFAEANGIAVNSGCRAGGCGSCQTTIAAGEVTYNQAPDYDPEPGSCLLCVCSPEDQRDPGGLNEPNGTSRSGGGMFCPSPCCSACWQPPPWPATICCTGLNLVWVGRYLGIPGTS
jgi:ferredoxin